MLDEPFTHLMPLHIEKLKEDIIAGEREYKGFIITDHMYSHLLGPERYRVYLMKEGKTIFIKDKAEWPQPARLYKIMDRTTQFSLSTACRVFRGIDLNGSALHSSFKKDSLTR